MKHKLKYLAGLLLSVVMLFTLSACGSSQTSTSTQALPSTSTTAPESTETAPKSEAASVSESAAPSESNTEAKSDGTAKTLVVYFSLTGEQYSVGVIEKGNTEILAEMIADGTGADTFKIEPVTPYPTTYDGLLDASQAEGDTRPEYVGEAPNLADYDTVFIGYPIWWGDMPNIVKGFLENNDFTGKTVVPFCTHAGSGLAGTQGTISDMLPGATVNDGLAIAGATAQNDRDSAQQSVTEFLTDGGYLE